MPLNFALEALNMLIELFRLSLITSIPSFIIALGTEQLHKRLSKRFSLSWAKSALISTYLTVTLLIMVLYSLPLYIGWAESPLTGQSMPPELQPVALDYLMFAVFFVLKIITTGLIFSILLLPLIFFSVYALEKAREKEKLPELANKFVAVFATNVLAWLVLLFVFPWVFGGLLYLLFWG